MHKHRDPRISRANIVRPLLEVAADWIATTVVGVRALRMPQQGRAISANRPRYWGALTRRARHYNCGASRLNCQLGGELLRELCRLRAASGALGRVKTERDCSRSLLVYKMFSEWGHVAEWLRNGLQNRVHQFNSGRGLQ
jgi:hypothetical protein